MTMVLSAILIVFLSVLSTEARGDDVHQPSVLSAEARWLQVVPAESRDGHRHGNSCKQVTSKVIENANLTKLQEEVVPLICWDDSDTAHATAAPKLGASRKGIPPGVECHPIEW